MPDDKESVYCICPRCKTRREIVNGKYTIVRRGYERNGFARFLCLNCGKWFNERTGESMHWFER